MWLGTSTRGGQSFEIKLGTSSFPVRSTRSRAPDTTESLVEAAPLDADQAIERTDQAECMIEAHEALVDADPENLARFKDVLEYLKQDLRAGSK